MCNSGDILRTARKVTHLICAADYLTDTILGLVPAPTCTQDAVDQLMVIFKQQVCTANDTATAQRVLRAHAQAERVIKEEQPTHVQQKSVQAQVTPSPSFEIKEKMTLATLPKVSLKSHKIGTTHCQLQTRINKEKQGPSHRNSCYNIWRYQDTRPHSPQDKQLQENIHFSFYATLYMQSLTTRQATSSNTATS